MRLFLCFCFFFGGLTASAQAQQNPCAAYQLSPDSPHAGPRQFNVIQIDYSHASSFVLILDALGRQIGTSPDGTRTAKIPHAFYEDGDEAVAATGLGPEQEPEEITIQYPQTGQYEIVATSRTGKAQSLRITIYNCGKQWSKEIKVSSGKPGAALRWQFVYQSSPDHQPEIVVVKSPS
jgi:hypothetical protein